MEPVRTCIGCRRPAPKGELQRLAWSDTEQRVVRDTRQVLPGRGCYLHPECVAAVVKRRAVARALRRPVDGGQVAALLGVTD